MSDLRNARRRDPISVGGPGLSIVGVALIARTDTKVVLSDSGISRMELSRKHIDRLVNSNVPVYGVSTGFGALANTWIPPERRSEIQSSIIRSHAAGVGPPMAREVVRAMMLLRLRTLAMGFSGVRVAVAQSLVDLLNAGITPVVPSYGSLGASGDLAPLAHVALCLIGEGEATLADGRTVSGGLALAEYDLRPLSLAVKEGLALINGTDGMLAMLCLALADARNLFKAADVTAAMSIEALLGTDRPFAQAVQSIRPHPGQLASAGNLLRLLAGSSIVASHRHSGHAVQDAYSLRCSPQVAGAARDTWEFANTVAERELGSVTDNPVVLQSGEIESTGNFHGEPLAFACDFLSIAAAEVGAIAERRVDRLLDPARSAGLPPFLAAEPGIDSGLMIAQYAAAALVAENRRLATPASVDSIPTSAMQEDHVSMGWGAALKLRTTLENLAAILAIELVCGARALDFRQPLTPSPATSAVRDLLRESVPGAGPDRWVAPDLASAIEIIRGGQVVQRAEAILGELR